MLLLEVQYSFIINYNISEFPTRNGGPTIGVNLGLIPSRAAWVPESVS